MFVCVNCYNKNVYKYSERPLSKVGSCDKCGQVRYVERVYKLIIKKFDKKNYLRE